eukprot:scaffold1006_cov408-Prasinococcus_capsulatus_cf.AAC.28
MGSSEIPPCFFPFGAGQEERKQRLREERQAEYNALLGRGQDAKGRMGRHCQDGSTAMASTYQDGDAAVQPEVSPSTQVSEGPDVWTPLFFRGLGAKDEERDVHRETARRRYAEELEAQIAERKREKEAARRKRLGLLPELAEPGSSHVPAWQTEGNASSAGQGSSSTGSPMHKRWTSSRTQPVQASALCDSNMTHEPGQPSGQPSIDQCKSPTENHAVGRCEPDGYHPLPTEASQRHASGCPQPQATSAGEPEPEERHTRTGGVVGSLHSNSNTNGHDRTFTDLALAAHHRKVEYSRALQLQIQEKEERQKREKDRPRTESRMDLQNEQARAAFVGAQTYGTKEGLASNVEVMNPGARSEKARAVQQLQQDLRQQVEEKARRREEDKTRQRLEECAEESRYYIDAEDEACCSWTLCERTMQ